MDTQTLATIIIQGGALVVLGLVLNAINQKVDKMIDLNAKLIDKLIDKIDSVTVNKP